MKAAFVSVLALAMSAFAAPTAQPGLAVRDVKDVQDAVKGVETIVTGAGVTEIVDGATKAPGKRAITDAQDLIATLTGAVSSLQGQQSSINDIISQFQNDKLSQAAAADQSASQFQNMKFTLTDIVTKLTGSAGLTVAGSDVDTVLNLVVNLVSIVLATVKTVVTILGVQPQLNSILHSVFQILSKLLVLVTGLVVALVPGLVAALSPLLAGLGNGLLAPLLTPVAGLLAGLGAGAP